MGLFDFLFGKKPSDSLPSWAQNIYSNPAPQWQQYLQTGMMPEVNSSSGSSGFSNTQSNTKGNSSTRTTAMPFFKPEELPLANAVRGRLMNRMSAGSALPQAYQALGLRNIGRTSESAMKGLEGNLAARGITGGMGMEGLYADRSAQQSDFLNSIPLLERNLENEDLGMVQGYLGNFGAGSMSQSDTKSASATNSNTQTGSSGWSNTPAQFDYGGYGNLMGSIMPYYNAPRQGGLLSADMLGMVFGTLFGPGGKFNTKKG